MVAAKTAARTRGASNIDFQSATTGIASKSMRNELNQLIAGVEDPAARRAFDAEMSGFFTLFNRYLAEKAKGEKLYVPVATEGTGTVPSGGETSVPLLPHCSRHARFFCHTWCTR